MYAVGEGTTQDNKKAFEWWSKAAEQGNTKAQLNIGIMYERGAWVSTDVVMAHMFWSIAALNGSKDGAKKKDEVAKKMKPSQKVESQRLMREWIQMRNLAYEGKDAGWCISVEK